MNISACRSALVLALALSASLPILARGYFNSPAPLTVPHPTSFAECRQFFPEGRPPVVPKRPALRELCYEAFAVLHSGESKTPVYVAQRLNRKSIEDADERRADKFFADARLPAADRAELEDYKRSGFSRGHMAPAGDCLRQRPWHRAFLWRIWSLRTHSKTVVHGPRLSKTPAGMCSEPRGMCMVSVASTPY